MTTQPPLPPESSEEKSGENLVGAASARVLEEVSEALNGLKELAARVQPSSAVKSSHPVSNDPEEQLSLKLPEVESTPILHIRRPRVGETLREVRESSGFSLEDVAAELKIKLSYLEAIEEGRYGDLPSRTYAVGFVRAYAQALGLQSEELVARCRAEVGSMPKTAAPLVMREPVTDKRLPGGTLMTICAVLAVLVYAASYSFLRPEPVLIPAPALPPSPPPVEASAPETPPPAAQKTASDKDAMPPPVIIEGKKTPEASGEAAETSGENANEKIGQGMAQKAPAPREVQLDSSSPAPEEKTAAAVAPPKPAVKEKEKPPSRIKLRAMEDTEVSILDRDGRVLTTREIHKGEAFFVPDHRHLTLATSDAGAIRLQVDGHDMPPLGTPGEAMHNIPLNPSELLQALE